MRLSVFTFVLLTPALASAQSVPPPTVTHPTVTVTAQKEPADPQGLPVSVTVVPLEALWNGGMTTIGELSLHAPNTYFSDFTARKLSNPRFRGLGSSPANPAVTTYIDGVPQLNTNSSSIELLDVNQVEFVRGPQSMLFGRNTLGGVVNISSARPSLSRWTGSAIVPFGNFASWDVRANASGPIGSKAAVGFAIAHAERDGFTTNDVTGNDLDYRDGTSAKAQLLLTPAANWEARLIYTGERGRDGDYALMDLGSLRTNPRRAQRDFEGHTDRDVHATTVTARRTGALTFTSTTGFVNWKTLDETDLDYTPLPLITRSNEEKDFQFTQEVRVASGAGGVPLAGSGSLRWQAGVFLFTQNYEQDATNTFAPFVLSPVFAFGATQDARAALDDTGVGLYGNGTLTFDKLDVTLGARFDRENRKGVLTNILGAPNIGAFPVTLTVEESFANVSPQAAAAYRVAPDAMVYASLTGGFKAGGFNPSSPTGQEVYDEEKSWNVEGGLKTSWLSRRVTANVAVFTIDWTDLQLNLPNPAVPGQFYIANVGSARSSGVEVEVNGRARDGVDLFATFGYTRARFGAGTLSSGVSVAENKVPNTPDYTASFGARLSRALTPGVTLYGGGEAVFYGAFKYDDMNLAGQDAYALVNIRGGARGRRLFAEGWIRNAFDTHYVPVAFAYGQLAQSGFIGESGRPRTFGITAGISF
ncbi:MAG TPA: TonB-dependent receptor [Vicinamibacterales bacterium]|nr:TonB-dependent receptor [Vicinamibacterales bacterium]